MRALGALVADVLAVVIFLAVGLIQHGEPLTMTTVMLVAWPFVVGVLLGHLAIRAWNRPFAIWPQGVFVWAITVVAAMALRTLFGAPPPLAFVLVTAGVLGLLMLGWRAVASFVTRHERRQVLREKDLVPAGESGASGAGASGASEAGSAAAGSDAAGSSAAGSSADDESVTGT